ncbi:multimeric flavodoxin WrbA [Candidatus Scalindua japonica]|uniref:Multimeric flavodoxin WrbA n=2 Tax=Candidatus Scalindua japonica TaxID=1284222 RepID=A0A286U0V5_9BACT|nr:multimeric flavodoxin WrbA [Candidatus Scalindua japonica]
MKGVKVLGISGSPRKSHTTQELVKTILDATDLETEFISLHDMTINGCICCLGCIKDNVCKVRDDYIPLMHKVLEADAIVIGAPNYFGRLNALTHSFLERFYCFRHDKDGHGGMKLSGKVGAIASVGGGGEWEMPGREIKMYEIAGDDIKGFFDYNEIECVGLVAAQGAVACFSCGYGEVCRVSGVKKFFGKDVKITPEIIPCLEKQPDVMNKAKLLGRSLRERLEKNFEEYN